VLGRNDVLPPVSPDAERLPRSSAMEAEEGLDLRGDDTAKSTVAGSGEHDSIVSMQLDAIEYDATSTSPGKSELSLMDDADFAALSASFDSERKQLEESVEAHPPAMALDDLLRAQSDDAATDTSDTELDRSGAGSAATAPPGAPTGGDSSPGLSLVGMDVDLSTPRAARVDSPEVNINVSHLELAPLEDTNADQSASVPNVVPTAGPAASSKRIPAAEQATSSQRGLIAIVAGLGGPDAVRQFLGALPATLSVPVLLWQHLDAGKHDRLAQQLGKASKLPVYLAQSGELARPGAVGVMGVGLGVISDHGWWIESGSASVSQGLDAALKDPTTVVAILSGAEPAIVEPARAHRANGGKVFVQTSSTCFDGTAASALENQGVTAGSPADLAAFSASSWLS